jgi:hypothetical protein
MSLPSSSDPQSSRIVISPSPITPKSANSKAFMEEIGDAVTMPPPTIVIIPRFIDFEISKTFFI